MEWKKLVRHMAIEGLKAELKSIIEDVQHFGSVVKWLYIACSILAIILFYITVYHDQRTTQAILFFGFGVLITFTILGDMSISEYLSKKQVIEEEIKRRGLEDLK